MQTWQHSVIYQIYPKSFHSHAGNATGDLLGIVDKLDYLKWLGVDCLWITPFLRSPQRDNGYDISDYYAIDPSYGSMADCELLIREAGARGLKLMLDIVVNHTSIEHEWFQQARSSLDNPYRDFYIWRDQPNNWESKFGGSAWEYEAQTGQYYLHLFDHTQADLNWDNPQVRAEVFKMMRFWRDKGVGGFRLDVINLISKPADFPEDNTDGRRFYTDGPNVHEYLQEMHREVFAGHDLVSVGEMSSTSLEHCIRYSRPDSEELSMTFNFHHLKVDYPNMQKWLRADFDFLQLKGILSHWQTGMQAGGGWNALFWCNHDQPRIVSRFGDDSPEHRVNSAKTLATVLHLHKGTPYLYQGEELGLPEVGDIPNDARQDPSFFRDRENTIGRDGCRVPLPWKATGTSLGFGDDDGALPHLPQPAWFADYSVASQEGKASSHLNLYRSALTMRRHLQTAEEMTWHNSVEGTLHFSRPGNWHCITNFGTSAVPLPTGEVLIGSELGITDELPGEATAWLKL